MEDRKRVFYDLELTENGNSSICKLCRNAFNEPKLLACLHSVCEYCLQQRSFEGRIYCPDCQAVTSVSLPGEVKSQLSSSFLLVANSGDLGTAADGQCDMECAPCEDETSDANPASHRCRDCQLFLCEFHAAIHKRSDSSFC